MAFNTNLGKQIFTAGAAQTDFDFNFKIFEEADLKVYLTPSGDTPEDATDILTYETDYTVTIDGDNGGIIVLVSPASVGDTIILLRDLPKTRTTNYVTGGDFIADTLDEDQDYQTYLSIDVATLHGRVLLLPNTDISVNNELPSSVSGGYLRLKEDGTGFEYLDNLFSIEDVVHVTSIAQMLTVDPNVTSRVVASGYYTSNDGGGGVYNYDVSQAAINNGVTIYGWEKEFSGPLNVKCLGAKGDGTTDDTIPTQNAIDYVNSLASYKKGGTVFFPTGIFISSKITLKERVRLVGDGRGATILKLKAGTNDNLLEVPAASALCGWNSITFDGHRGGNLSGGCIYVASTSSSDGNSFAPFTDKIDVPPESYKHMYCYDFDAGNAAVDGIFHEPSNYKIMYNDFSVSHCGRDGFAVYSSDGMYSNFYIEKNDRAGLYASGSTNKYSNGKVIWNGRVDKTYGNLREQGSYNIFNNVEAQDSYTDGILILGNNPMFINVSSNRNGYLSVGSEDQSTRAHADIRIGSTASAITFIGKVYSYATGVGSDGFWTTEYPYYFNSFSLSQITNWLVEFSPAKYNSAPNLHVDKLVQGALSEFEAFSTDGSNSFLDIGVNSLDGAGDCVVRFFRNNDTSGTSKLFIYEAGTAHIQHQLNSSGNSLLNQREGNTIIGDGVWNGQHLRLGTYHFWVDASERLRIKDSSPTSDTDGTIVGTQT